MFHTNKAFKLINPGMLSSLIMLALALGFSTALSAEEPSGYISDNSSDLPPSLEKDPSTRSTDTDRPPSYGPDEAKVLIVTFADFECPACRRASQATHQIAGEFPGDVRMEFRNNPLPNHKTAGAAATAAMAAHQQGKFWEMHDLLFKNPRHDQATLEKNASDLGLDLEQFKADMQNDDIRQKVNDDIALAQALGARRTPTFLVNGKRVEGWASWNYFVNQVKREVARVNTLSEQGMNVAEILDQRAIDNHADSASYEAYRQNFLEPLAK